MSAISERKTLSIKGKPGMWLVPSTKEVVQKKLQETIKAILENYMVKIPKSANYNETYRLNASVMSNLLAAILEAHGELVATLKFKNQADKIFENIVNDASLYLKKEVGEQVTTKFSDAYEQFAKPKQSLPKVFLSGL